MNLFERSFKTDILSTHNMDNKKISLLIALLLYVTFCFLVTCPFFCGLFCWRHLDTLTTVTPFKFSNLKVAIPDVAQCLPPQHSLLVSITLVGILSFFIAWSFLFFTKALLFFLLSAASIYDICVDVTFMKLACC